MVVPPSVHVGHTPMASAPSTPAVASLGPGFPGLRFHVRLPTAARLRALIASPLALRPSTPSELQIFETHLLSKERFESDPALLYHPELRVRIGDSITDFQSALRCSCRCSRLAARLRAAFLGRFTRARKWAPAPTASRLLPPPEEPNGSDPPPPPPPSVAHQETVVRNDSAEDAAAAAGRPADERRRQGKKHKKREGRRSWFSWGGC